MNQLSIEANHYTILNLSFPQASSKPPSAQDIKQAYRQALLTHHPDKSEAPQEPQTLSNDLSKPSIDSIKLAYTVLSSPSSRQSYDRILLLQVSKQSSTSQPQRSFHPGSETLDLDDLNLDDETGIWYLPCRCGEKRGYVVREEDLEREELRGGREVVVGCVGCSLWVRIGFGVVEEGNGNGDMAGTGGRKEYLGID